MAGGYLRAAKSAGAFLVGLLSVAAISTIVVMPLWFFATRHTALYTAVSICALTAAVFIPFAVRLAGDPAKRRLFLKRCARFAIFLILAASLYLLVLLYAGGLFLMAAPFTILYVAVTGLILRGKRSA